MSSWLSMLVVCSVSNAASLSPLDPAGLMPIADENWDALSRGPARRRSHSMPHKRHRPHHDSHSLPACLGEPPGGCLPVCFPQVTPMTQCTHARGFVDLHQFPTRCRILLSAGTPPCETGQTVVFVLQASAAPPRRCMAFGQAYRRLSRCCGMLHSEAAAAATPPQHSTSRAPTLALASWRMCSLRMYLALRPPPSQVLSAIARGGVAATV